MSGLTSRGLRHMIFGMCVGTVFMLTHYPQLTLPFPGRPDLVAHMSMYGVWTLLCGACGWFGRPLGELNIWRSSAVSLVYCGLDEWSQAIPFIRRTAALDDFGANALGVMLATALLLVIARLAGPPRPPAGTMPAA